MSFLNTIVTVVSIWQVARENERNKDREAERIPDKKPDTATSTFADWMSNGCFVSFTTNSNVRDIVNIGTSGIKESFALSCVDCCELVVDQRKMLPTSLGLEGRRQFVRIVFSF